MVAGYNWSTQSDYNELLLDGMRLGRIKPAYATAPLSTAGSALLHSGSG